MRAPLLALLLLLAAAPAARAQFTLLTVGQYADFLNVADPADGFGAEDKLVACKGDLVFVDLDESVGTLFKYATATGVWSRAPIADTVCDGGNSPPMWPRDAGYVVAVTQNPTPDRLIVLGGDPADVNVWFSDDCGITWTCSTTPQAWQPRQYAATVDAAGILQGNPLVFAGGVADLESIAQFHSADGGITWSRPRCAAATPCQQDCLSSGMSDCTLPEADPVGSCSGADFNLCYLLPDMPCFPGSIASDWNTIYYWLEPNEDGMLWKLDNGTLATGWSLVNGATYGGFGRRQFIKGAASPAGCWFSTDFSAEDLWIGDDPTVRAASMNDFAVSSAAAGPWRYFSGNSTWPWAKRASAAVVSGPGATSVIVGSGMTFVNGVAQGPVYSDVWRVDAGVCLLSQLNNQVCAGFGVADLAGVNCTCNAASNISPYCDQCNDAGMWGLPGCTTACPKGTGAGVCNNNAGATPSGTCDPLLGCVCAAGWTNGGSSNSCDTCANGFFGPSCTACTCDQIGNGGPTECDGSGSGPTRTGSGQCTACKPGFTGDGGIGNCDQCVAGNYGQQCLACPANCVAPGGACNQGRSGDGSCVCAAGWANAPAGCTDCAINYWGPSCTVCATCNAPGGLCSGSGSHGGDGTCVCQPNWANPANGCSDCAVGAWGISCSLCTCDPLGGTCSGSGTHGGDGTCGGVCNAGFAGVNCETCAAGFWGPSCTACTCDSTGGVCSGSGSHGGDGSCQCNAGFTGASCNQCKVSNYGPTCAACAACSSVGGTCDGGGSRSGSGACICDTGFTGSTCSSCLTGYYGSVCTPCKPCSPSGGTCSGSGTNGGDGSCVCKTGWRNSNCATCQLGYYGATCTQCLPCDSTGGKCDGSGTNSGAGTCVCNAGFQGADCSVAVPAASAAALDPGTAAGVGVGVSAALVALGLWVFVARFGGGPSVSAAVAFVGKAVAGAVPAGSAADRSERASILRAAPVGARAAGGAAAPYSASAAASRFASLSPAGAAAPAAAPAAVYSNL